MIYFTTHGVLCPALHGVIWNGNQAKYKLLNYPGPVMKCGTPAQMAEWYGASVSSAVDLGLIPSRVKPLTLKLVFVASLLDVQH